MNSDSEPRGWRTEIPQYKATRDLRPPAFARMTTETPWSSSSEDDVWQYLQQGKVVRAGEVISSPHWPHPSFRPAGPIDEPANYAAEKILSFFSTAMKSRLGLSPFRGDRIELDDGLSGPTQPNIKIGTAA